MSEAEYEYGPARPDELAALTTLLAQALHFEAAQMERWLGGIGSEHLRAVRRRGRVVAGLGIIKMDQWFGGARVPTAAITAVGVAPEQRGRGVGGRLMRGLLAELHADGLPISVLYPSTLSFYRSVGYERAGSRITYELPLTAITRRTSALEIEPIKPGNFSALVPLYDKFARRTTGMFERVPLLWHAICAPGFVEVNSYLITDAGVPQGYLVLSQGGRHEPLRIRDLVLLNRAAGQRALNFLTDYRIFVDQVVWVGSPGDRLIALLPEQRYKMIDGFDWVLRIIDVRSALTSRGYQPSLRAELHLDVNDDLFEHNNGRWLVAIADGQAEVRPGGDGRIRLGIRDLAGLYSGHLKPVTLQFSGALSGPDEDLALLELVFSGPAPRLTDPF